MSEEKEAVPAYQKTQEWLDLVKRCKKLNADKKAALLELTPIHKFVYGGFSIMGIVKDTYGNIVANTNNRADRLGIGPNGASFRFDFEKDLKYIYQILHCPIYQSKMVPFGSKNFKKSQHRFFFLDQEAESEEYADRMQEDNEYKNQFYTKFQDETISFLCIIGGLDPTKSLPVKRADLCKLWDAGRTDGVNSTNETARLKVKEMMDSPDIDFFETAYNALKQGEPLKNKGFYKTQNGVYKFNDEILGNSIEQVVAYFKMNDEVYISYKKKETPKEKKPLPVT